ncbi:MAG TPA: 6-bladed beta-propeller [Candidatus Nitrosocosmicus sp.]|nr:6-bladed beta-propeller [Candidatus Nitrosocosmicus sp.]
MQAQFFVIFTLAVLTTAIIGISIAGDNDNELGIFSYDSYFLASFPSILKINNAYGQASDLQMPALSLSSPYSDLPTGIGDTLSGLDSFENELSDSVKEKIHPGNTQNEQGKTIAVPPDIDEDGSDNNPSLPKVDLIGSAADIKNVYVVDYNNIRIQKFTDDGKYVLKWGTKGKENGQFGVPHGIDLDKRGNVYVVDMDNNNVQKFDSEGNFILKWGSMGTDDGQFMHPHSVILDSFENVYVTDMANFNVQKFDSEGNFILKWGSMGTDDGQFKRPAGLDIDDSDNIYVVDAGNSRIQKFSPDGQYLNSWGSKGPEQGQMASPHDIAVDSEENTYVVEQDNFRVQKFSPDGQYLASWGTQGSNNDQFLDPHSVVVGP